jgi:hydroxymethylpyrimidine pyrophosphatase-like HAD family hydrolase
LKVLENDRPRKLTSGKRICVDLDGVIHRYSLKYHDGSLYDIPMKGARDFMQKLKDRGFCVVIFTARPLDVPDYNEGIKTVEEWLDRFKIPYDYVTSLKVPATAYIDDRAIHFDGDWNQVEKNLEKIEKANTHESFEGEQDWGYYDYDEDIGTVLYKYITK